MLYQMQRIGNIVRRGRIENIDLERFFVALRDPTAGLTYPALTGERKQSAQDVERLFGQSVIEFMERNEYMEEARYLKVVRNWRRAIDERGLHQSQRLELLKEFLDFIYRDLMPWYNKSEVDFSLLEVKRCKSCIILQNFTSIRGGGAWEAKCSASPPLPKVVHYHCL